MSTQIEEVTRYLVSGLGEFQTQQKALEALENRAEKELRKVFPALCQPICPKDQRILVEYFLLHRTEIVKVLDF